MRYICWIIFFILLLILFKDKCKAVLQIKRQESPDYYTVQYENSHILFDGIPRYNK